MASLVGRVWSSPLIAQLLAHIKAVHEGGNPVLLETFLDGPEVSLFCLVDGETVVPLLPAQDHKRVGENDGATLVAWEHTLLCHGCLKMEYSASSMRCVVQ